MTISILCDFRSLFGSPRDQGARPTCLAFAASDYHAALREGWIPLSCEYIFYHAQRRAGRKPNEGATLGHILDVIRDEGQPAESSWPYLTTLPTNLDDWVPPATIGTVYRRASDRRSNEFDELVALLDGGLPALVLLNLSDAFYEPDQAGVIVASPSEQPDPHRRHAVVAVALGSVRGEQAVLVRNSWGNAWGISGHGWLPKSYLAPRLTSVAVFREEIHVLANRTAA